MIRCAKRSAFDFFAAPLFGRRGVPLLELLQNCNSCPENSLLLPDKPKSADGLGGDALPLADLPGKARICLGSAAVGGISGVSGNAFEDSLMGRVFWISSACVAVALLIGAAVAHDPTKQVEPVAFVEGYAEPELGSATELEVGDTGSALATAAFGLSALQPETFNSQIVRDIIEASPLAYGEKDRLTAKLIAAQAGRAELPEVLEDIRISLAVE